jgi:hypothetical protein
VLHGSTFVNFDELHRGTQMGICRNIKYLRSKAAALVVKFEQTKNIMAQPSPTVKMLNYPLWENDEPSSSSSTTVTDGPPVNDSDPIGAAISRIDIIADNLRERHRGRRHHLAISARTRIALRKVRAALHNHSAESEVRCRR